MRKRVSFCCIKKKKESFELCNVEILLLLEKSYNLRRREGAEC